MLFPSLTVIDDAEPRAAALNMALDEALLFRAEGPILRAYRWASPAVSFGYFGQYEEARRQFPQREVVRRWTGGGTVDHAQDFTYSLIMPGLAAISSREIYWAVHAVIAVAWGEDAGVARTDSERISSACFENPVAGDVLVGGRKVAGAALRRTRRGLLLQGSVSPVREGLLRRLADDLAAETSAGAILEETAILAERMALERYATDAWLKRK